ncbi:MAG TPA: hypothetical protein VEA18_01825 [Candidatus Kapabacteria bacterium]|nr:hypothetical protein [Candidatus Kapabacteria bacterium]
MNIGTQTMTKSVTNTHLAVATAVLLAAGGLAYIAAGTAVPSSTSTQTYQNGYVTCYDDPRKQIPLDSLCLTDAQYRQKASILCAGKCNSAGTKCGVNGGSRGTQCIPAEPANVTISPTNDPSTVSRILLSSNSQMVQIGKWDIQAHSQNVSVDKLTFHLTGPSPFSGQTNLNTGNFSHFALFDETNMTTPVATSEFVPGAGRGYVRFVQPNMLTLPAGQQKKMVLKAVVNESDLLEPGSVYAWTIQEQTTENMQMRSADGSTLSSTQIDISTALLDTDTDNRATSTWYLYHATAPIITNIPLDPNLQVSTQAPIFKYRISNPGTRELRISSTTVKIGVAGLAANGSATGSISGFELWELNSTGNLGTRIATNTLGMEWVNGVFVGCLSAAPSTQFQIPGSGHCLFTTGTLNVHFTPRSDLYNLLDNLVIQAGSSRSFAIVANTTNMLSGKTSGVVSVFAKLDGNTGLDGIWNYNHERYWSDGPVHYFYTPVNGVENRTSYTASDSYDVIGTTLSRTL